MVIKRRLINGRDRFNKIAAQSASPKGDREQGNLIILLFLSDQYNRLYRNRSTVSMLIPARQASLLAIELLVSMPVRRPSSAEWPVALAGGSKPDARH